MLLPVDSYLKQSFSSYPFLISENVKQILTALLVVSYLYILFNFDLYELTSGAFLN